jgi:hypothetical protein
MQRMLTSPVRRIAPIAAAVAGLLASAGAAHAQGLSVTPDRYLYTEGGTVTLTVTSQDYANFAPGSWIEASVRGDATAASPSYALGRFNLPSTGSYAKFTVTLDDSVRELTPDYRPTIVLTTSAGNSVKQSEWPVKVTDNEPASAPTAGAAPAPTPTPAAAAPTPTPAPAATQPLPGGTAAAGENAFAPSFGDSVLLRRGTRKVRIELSFPGKAEGVLGIFRNNKLVGKRWIGQYDTSGATITRSVVISRKAAASLRRSGGTLGVAFLGTGPQGEEIYSESAYRF